MAQNMQSLQNVSFDSINWINIHWATQLIHEGGMPGTDESD
jgi:hypothetical protein